MERPTDPAPGGAGEAARVRRTRDGHVVLDNPGRETGDDDRMGGAGLPTNQGGGRDGGGGTRGGDGEGFAGDDDT